jgi:uncharacterized protein (DUF2147 family)
LWRSIDDKTGQALSLIRIEEHDGVLSGRVEKILTSDTDRVCVRCTGELRDKPVLGMTVITGMARDGDKWSGGNILDPGNGKTYRGLIRILDNGRKLEVRGYIGVSLFGRSQTWLREE